MSLRVDEEITFRKLEMLLAFMETGNLARASEMLDISSVSVHRALHSLERAALPAVPPRGPQSDSDRCRAGPGRRRARRAAMMPDGIRATREVAGYSAERIRIGSLYSLTIGTIPASSSTSRCASPSCIPSWCWAPMRTCWKSWAGRDRRRADGLPEPDPTSNRFCCSRTTSTSPRPSGRATPHWAVDLRACANERFVSLSDGFVTYNGFLEAFVAGFTPKVVMKVGDIFSLMNLVSGGVGFTLLPGRVRDVLPEKVQLIPLEPIPDATDHRAQFPANARTRSRTFSRCRGLPPGARPNSAERATSRPGLTLDRFSWRKGRRRRFIDRPGRAAYLSYPDAQRLVRRPKPPETDR